MKPGTLLSVCGRSNRGTTIIWETGDTSAGDDRIGDLHPGEFVVLLETGIDFTKVVSKFGIGWIRTDNIESVMK